MTIRHNFEIRIITFLSPIITQHSLPAAGPFEEQPAQEVTRTASNLSQNCSCAVLACEQALGSAMRTGEVEGIL